MRIDKLKEQARRHEQQEQWSKALDFYLQAIEVTEKAEEPDISLFNRVGDLQVRVGDTEGAVGTYERAIDLYMDAELPNNAIAICQKIIRNVPGKPDPFLKMGQIRARQGFVVDARQAYLTYAEMRQTRGATEEAFRALDEFVSLIPGDVETRLFLAEQLAGRGEVEAAVTHFEMAYRHLLRDGEQERAEKVQARVAELAPDAVLSSEPLPDEEEAPLQGGLVGFETTSMQDEMGLDAPVEAEAETAGAEEEVGAGDLAFSDIGGLDAVEDEEAAPEASEAIEEAHEEAFGELDLSGMDEEDADEDEDEDEAAPLPGLDALDEDEEEPAFDVGDDEEGGGLDDLTLGEFETEDEESASDDDPTAQPDREEVFGKPPGEAIEEGFEAAERVADPDDNFAPDPAAPADEPGPGAGGGGEDRGGYVDLGSMVLDEQGGGTTRWKVQTEAPSGDEEADFARMLSQFKEKVAQNLDTGDFTARYDLGAAYKDMGLMDEAITEFQAALRADPKSLAAMEMLGQCFLEKGEPQAAVRTLQRALAVPNDVEDDFLGIYYYLGKCHEATGDKTQALEAYEKVFSLDINFRDVTERLRALR